MIFLGGIEVIRREVLISLTQLMEMLQHVSVTLNSVRKIKTETLVLCSMHVEDYVFFYLSSKGTNTINKVFIFFVLFFKSKPLLRVQPQQHFPTLMGNGFESWRA